MPDFIIIGAQKSGTTSLHAYLSQHPQLVPAAHKELHFFDGGLDPSIDNFKKGIQWYYSQFPTRANLNSSHRTFEASPLYIFNPDVPRRIYSLFSDVKIIALLRNPAERAISHYYHVKSRGKEPLAIEDAFRQEEKRLEQCLLERNYKDANYRLYSYISRGRYKEQLERYFKFFSRNQVLAIPSEEFFVDPETILRQVYRFVNVDEDYKITDLEPRNVSCDRDGSEQAVYSYLNHYFESHNKSLYQLLGQDFGW